MANVKGTHRHHILPRHAGGTDDPSNIVVVTIPEHAELHRQLWEQNKRWQDYAAWMALSNTIPPDKVRCLAISLALRGRKRPEFSKTMLGHRGWNTGKTFKFTGAALEAKRASVRGSRNGMFGLRGPQHPAYGKIGSLAPKVTCPHCDKTLDKGNAKKWHFDKCKRRIPHV